MTQTKQEIKLQFSTEFPKNNFRGYCQASGRTCGLLILLLMLNMGFYSDAAIPEQKTIDSQPVKEEINWASFLARHDLVWNRLPARWIEGAFIGNGRLGAMIYKGEGEKAPGAEVLAWTIGRSDLYDEPAPGRTKKGHPMTRVPIGRFHILPVGHVKAGDLRFVLWDGEAHGTIRTDRGEIRWRSWVQDGDADSGVVVVDVETDMGERGVAWKWQPFSAEPPRTYGQKSPFQPNPDGYPDKDGKVNLWVQPFLAGGDYVTAWQSMKLGETHQVLLVAVGYVLDTGSSAAKAVAAIKAAAERGVAVLREENRAWWHMYYPKSFLSIPDARLESQYWIQMYKLGAAMRPGSVVVDTCGPWLKMDTAWAACWWNLNTQLFHYPIPVANHLEMYEPLVRLVRQEFANGDLINNAPESMRYDSAFLGNPTSVHNLIQADIYWKGNNASGRSRPGLRLNELPWTCHTLWEYYRRNMDDAFLRETLFPLTRRAFNFIFHYLEEGKDGRLHIKDVFSSEYGTADDANEALAMIQWGCQTLPWMSDRLKINDPDIPRWKDILNRLAAPPVDQNGLMIGSDVPFEKSHRHYSHLMSLVPFRTWNFQDPKARELAYRSIGHFLNLKDGLRGFSYTGASSMYAMLGDGDRALDCLRLYLKSWDRVNTMYTEGRSPVMETPLSAARSVQDMLLQSHDVIRVFPAVPTSWKDVAFNKLLAEGAFEVSAVRRAGKTQFVRIRSLAGEPCRVKVDLEHPVRLVNKGEVMLKVDDAGIITLNLQKNEEAVLVTSGFTNELTIQPVAVDPKQCNFYGLK